MELARLCTTALVPLRRNRYHRSTCARFSPTKLIFVKPLRQEFTMLGKRRASARIAADNIKKEFSDDPIAVDNGSVYNNKRRKVNEKSKEDKIIDFLVDYNMAVNELFQLKEYGSIVDWNPTDFASFNLEKPDLFEYFIKDNNFELKWLHDEDDNVNLDDLPLRLQKKVIAEMEAKTLAKFPFKEFVVEQAMEKELVLIQQIDNNSSDTPPKYVAKPKTVTKAMALTSKKIKLEKKPIKQEFDENEEITKQDIIKHYLGSDIDDDLAEYTDMNDSDADLETEIPKNMHLRTVKFKIKDTKITHPSHIPGWKPPKGENTIDEEDKQIIDFHPTPVEVITTKQGTQVANEVGAKLSDFLENKFKFAIIDEGTTEYNNTPKEYKEVMDQQMHLFKRLYEKITIENSLELNGDKIEKRKLTLPQTNARQSADPFRATGTIVPKAQAQLGSTYMDNLLSQGVSFSRLHQQVRKQRQARVRRIATMVDQHFKWKSGEKERIAKEREQNLKKISRLAIQAVKKRWTQAQKVYKFLQDQKEEELKKIKGREHLSNMLEHSTQLLEAQLTREESEDSQSASEDLDDELSSSESESVDDTMDDRLSVDKLREKYLSLNEYSNNEETAASTVSSDDMDSQESDADFGNGGLASLYGHEVASNEITSNGFGKDSDHEISEEQKALVDEMNKEEYKILSEDDSSSSEFSSENSDDESESEDENEQVEDNGNDTGLSSLLMNGNGVQEESDESVGETLMEVDSADDRLSSTDEEDEPKTPKSESNLRQKESELPETEVNGSKVRDVPVPSLLRGTLRPYQKQGLNWLASLYNNDTNGILADEMGLGKTIQTISLLAHLATEYHVWGPHLIIVPTSVMLNWEMEFKKFAPGFKVLTYYGSPQQRAQKRKGWNKPDTFHVCITSYQLVVHDHLSFKRRRWKYMILDEAHNIKNFRSTRWKALLNFNTENRLLLTGTPLQNNLMELWSLLYFLMPSSKVNQAMPEGFANLEDFQTWFGKPVDNILEQVSTSGGDLIDENESTVKAMDQETRNTVARLHQVLRPYILRRLKKDVEKQMPGKYEHIVYCRLSQRQRYLYDDFMSRAKTKETLASGNFLSIINCLMQLRKVCNHPNLFEVRPIVTSLAIPTSVTGNYRPLKTLIEKNLVTADRFSEISREVLNLDLTSKDNMNLFVAQETDILKATYELRKQVYELDELIRDDLALSGENSCLDYYIALKREQQMDLRHHLQQMVYLNDLRCGRTPIYGESLLRFLQSATKVERQASTVLDELIVPIDRRVAALHDIIDTYAVITPRVVALDMSHNLFPAAVRHKVATEVAPNLTNPFHQAQVKLSIAFPDKSLLQYDCGKLQMLDRLLQQLTSEGHRALIFTQMTKVLDILEQFLNIHGYLYMRLDGATKIEDRQLLTEKFNRDAKIPVFILSSRSGGLGINLTGADTVIFYDSDWNPAMDKQCQDRCHRIGQVRDVHIYRFVSEHTIESNILRKANQKRQLDNVVIQEGDFTTDYFGKFSVRDIVDDTTIASELPDQPLAGGNLANVLAQAEDEDDRAAASAALRETVVDDDDFNDDTAGPPKPKDNNDDMDYEDGVGHIDEYMLRFMANGYYE